MQPTGASLSTRPATLSTADVYVAVGNGYYDAAGNQGASASATFTVDTTAPTVSSFSPANGAVTVRRASASP